MRVQGGHWGSGAPWGFRGHMGAQGSHGGSGVTYLSLLCGLSEYCSEVQGTPAYKCRRSPERGSVSDPIYSPTCFPLFVD